MGWATIERRQYPIENFLSAIRTTISTLRATLSRVTTSFLPLLPPACRLIATLFRQQYSRWPSMVLRHGKARQFHRRDPPLFVPFLLVVRFRKFARSRMFPRPRAGSSIFRQRFAFFSPTSPGPIARNIDFPKVSRRQSNLPTCFSSLWSSTTPFSFPSGKELQKSDERAENPSATGFHSGLRRLDGDCWR